MEQREEIHHYLKSLTKYLARLEKDDAQEVIREIESHIYDAIELKESNNEPFALDEILSGFGSPRELASQYTDHILDGAPPPKGFKAIQAIKQSVSNGLFYSTAIFGYGWAITFIWLGIYKLIFPSEIVIWEADHGNSFIIGGPAQMPEGSIEIVGMWLVPIALGLGLASGLLTRNLMRILKNKRN